MPETAFDEVFAPGDGDPVTRRLSRTQRTISDAEIERREDGAQLRQALPLLRTWAGDAKTAAEITAMTAAERIQRQSVLETRVAALARLHIRLIRKAGEDDGS